MATLDRALQIAAKAHEGQTDKEGLPYILHPLRVMAACEGLDAQIVAVLHDVVEDTSVTLEDLRDGGFSAAILKAVQCVTHHKEEPYADYVIRCKHNPLAREAKLADLQDNCRLTRVILRGQQIERDVARIRRYVLPYKFLTDQMSEEEYRKGMGEA